MPFRNMSTDEMRSVVRHQLETLERWLRRLVDDALRAHYEGTFAALPIKQDIKIQVADRRAREPQRYPREVDALLFNDLVTIMCHPQVYSHFTDALQNAFPDGRAEARTFLERIIEARNPLAHANDITSHQAFRVICYSADVIESLKAYYARNNLAQTYNAPSFLRIWDDRGNSAEINASITAYYDEFRQTPLRPGDTLQLEVQPDESFLDDSYRIEWSVQMANGESGSGRVFPLTIANHHVTQDGLPIEVRIISNLDWHKHGVYDAKTFVLYSVLPPI
jgi:Swt1-like HEPN